MKGPDKRVALREAAHWYARLGADQVGADVHQQWSSWHSQDALHQWAWQQVQNLQAQLQGLPGPLAYQAMQQAGTSAALGRRTLLKGLLLGVGAGSLGLYGYREAPVWLADYRTRIGQRQRITLADGTRLILNTASAVDVRFGAEVRLVIVQAGELLIETGKDPRPFVVRSAEGDMRALGTRFTVRQREGITDLSVLEHAVAVRSKKGTDAEQVIEANQRVSFSATQLYSPTAVDPNQAQWANGHLVIDNWRLDRLLAELQRYRPGFVQCSANIAELRLSGAYPLDDTDSALAAIARALPVRIEQRTRYWVRVLPKA
ncbi:FecR domain-containing protein [Pseudomonas turukhanskensis]|uniref:Sensor n=1 Tax=Pseudomonas turukhanskensis TaxID=1806536 RepID=A0A9W6K4Z4_9PSED|nr:FecR domain-containing protein [Pseudomonas turukhanskensis]GLK87830.1 sensor [Pseudomonas turukhanskensis]